MEKCKNVTSLRSTIIVVFMIALLSGIGGFALGRATAKSQLQNTNLSTSISQEKIDNAYSKGWICWFTGYGMHGESAQYMGQYVYGRKYGASFDSEFDAFTAGYKDGFYHVNHHDPDEGYNDRIEEGFADYFG